MGCKCHDYQHEMLDVNEVIRLIEDASFGKQAFSFSRFSHAEISYLSLEINPKLVKRFERYRAYGGGTGNPFTIRDGLVQALNAATLTGLIPKDCIDDGRRWYAHTNKYLHHADLFPDQICSVWATQEMLEVERFWNLLRSKKVAIVGRRASDAAPILKQSGVDVTKQLSLNGMSEMAHVHDQLLSDGNWDIALISAGLPATILAPELAVDSGKIAIDFGHALDMIVDRDAFDFENLIDQWNGESERD